MTVQLKDKSWKGTSALDFLIFKPKLRSAFIENKCWDLVEPVALPEAVIADAAGVASGAAVACCNWSHSGRRFHEASSC